MFGAVFGHHFGDLIVHLVGHADGLLLFLFGELAQYLGLDRTLGRECFHNRLGLKADHRFRQHRMKDPARSGPRGASFFYLESEEFESPDVSLFPILS